MTVTVTAVTLVVAGAALIGLGQHRAATLDAAPQVMGVGVVLFFGGIALVSFRSGDRMPWVVLGGTSALVAGFALAAVRRR